MSIPYSIGPQRIHFVTPLSIISGQLAVVEKMGRLCYRSKGKVKPYDPKFISKLIKAQHESVLEHCHFTVVLHTDIAVIRQIVRHRMASPSEQSGRYVNFTKSAERGVKMEFIYPPDYKAMLAAGIWEKHVKKLEAELDEYEARYALTGKPENARRSLSLEMATNYGLTANLREWRHIFKMRLSRAAEPQTRALIYEIYRVINKYWPFLVEDIEPYTADLADIQIVSSIKDDKQDQEEQAKKPESQ